MKLMQEKLYDENNDYVKSKSGSSIVLKVK
jgi:hypothetical protein